jgi:hypothetical protein
VSKLQKCLLHKDEQLRATTGSTEQVRSSLSYPYRIEYSIFAYLNFEAMMSCKYFCISH